MDLGLVGYFDFASMIAFLLSVRELPGAFKNTDYDQLKQW